MRNELIRWPVKVDDTEYELIVFECGTGAVFNRTSYLAAHPDPASRLFGMVVGETEMTHDHLSITPSVGFELHSLCREIRGRKHQLPSHVEAQWLEKRCTSFVTAWLNESRKQVLRAV